MVNYRVSHMFTGGKQLLMGSGSRDKGGKIETDVASGFRRTGNASPVQASLSEKKVINKISGIFALLAVLLSAFLHLPAGAQDEVSYYRPITDISLNIKELTMNVGDSFTLPVTYEPAETPSVFLQWYTDEKTIRIDPETFTVTALSAGSTRLLVESSGGFAWDHCDITVFGSEAKSPAETKAGTGYITLSDADRNKIRAESVLHYLDFIGKSSYTPEEYDELAGRDFHVNASVKPGTVTAQSKLAASFGMKKALALPDLDAVSMHGTLLQILYYVNNNDDLVKLIEFAPAIIEDPASEDENRYAAKGMNLKDNVEALTSVSTAHALGLKGDGAVIAVIDTGLNKNHEQFRGRVIAEYCAAFNSEKGDPYASCIEGSSEPSRVKRKEKYNHGSHVTGIAAGRDGIAPHAKIVSINRAGESCFEDYCQTMSLYDLLEVVQYLVDLQKEYRSAGKPQIVAVNMSYGSGGFSDFCDDEFPEVKKAFDLLMDYGIIPVNSSGNDAYIDEISHNACLSNSYAVGMLANDPVPTIHGNSNHSKLVDILAPGRKIWSAFYAHDGEEGTICSGINCYGYDSGTSMAAPMVTGAFAILKQADPDLTASQMKSLLRSMSTKSANFKLASRKYKVPEKIFDFDTPVLDFSDIEKYMKPEPGPDFWPVDMPVLPRTGFSSVHPQVLTAMPKDLKYEPLEMMLEIPSLDVTSEIVEVPVIAHEYAVTWLGNSVGLLEGSARSGEGTAVLAAHNHLNDTESGPFALLRFMEEGDRIFVRDNMNDLQTYAVYANVKAAETDFEAVDHVADAFDNTLILITCEDEMVSGGYANRRIIAARKVQ